MIDLSTFDKSTFTNEPYVKRVEKPWGYELHWVKDTMPYMGKVLHITSGKRLSLQVHDQKQESYFLVFGRCNLIIENKDGELITIEMEQRKGYTVVAGQRHRHEAITDCDVIEVSTPEIGTTYRLDDDYKRPDETKQQRKIERGEA